MDSPTGFLDFLVKSGVLLFGDFTTKSGRRTPYFINTGNFTTGAQLRTLGEHYAAALERDFGDQVTNLFGPAYKGIALATSAAIALQAVHGLDVTVSYNRKEVKDHGEGGWLIGHKYGRRPGGDRVVIVEDVTTAGTSIRETLPRLRAEAGTRVIGLVVAVDRQEKGPGGGPALRELGEEYGIKTVSLACLDDLLDYLRAGSLANQPADLLERMERYREEFGAR